MSDKEKEFLDRVIDSIEAGTPKPAPAKEKAEQSTADELDRILDAI